MGMTSDKLCQLSQLAGLEYLAFRLAWIDSADVQPALGPSTGISEALTLVLVLLGSAMMPCADIPHWISLHHGQGSDDGCIIFTSHGASNVVATIFILLRGKPSETDANNLMSRDSFSQAPCP